MGASKRSSRRQGGGSKGKGRGRQAKGRKTGKRSVRVVEGVLHVLRPSVATVVSDEGSFPVAKGGLREGMNGDVVRAAIVRREGRAMAYVQSVMIRATSTFIGIYQLAEPLGVVVPLDERMRRDFFVTPEDTSAQRLGVGEGDVVVARILAYPSRKSAGVVTLDRRVGAGSEMDLDMEAVVASYDLAVAFPEDALAEAQAIHAEGASVLAAEPGRRDLREACCLTVDPVDARDFDDAVSCRRLEDGGYEVGVHIADVSHYVRWYDAIDLEARRRTTSVYLADRVLPMLPERLCNDVCSLLPNEDRLCMSVVMRLSAKGEVVASEAFPSLIRSKARLDYGTVDAMLERMGAHEGGPAGAGTDPSELLPAAGGHAAEVAEALVALDEVSRLRQEIRRKRGAIDFDSREAKVVLDENGHPTGVAVRERTPATQLIEEAMLLANESVAAMLAEREVPAAFRVHERPSQDGLREAMPVLRELGLLREGVGERLAAGDPFAVQEALDKAHGTPAYYMVSQVLLRAQSRAIYLPQNLGHYALGASAYCHFTSPIRRYPDVIVHRALKALLAGTLGSKEQTACQKVLPQLCRDCSERERVADAASRMSQKVKMAEYYAPHVGEVFSGIVSGVERFGLFVMLEDTCAEGLVPVRLLGQGWCDFDEERHVLRSGSGGKSWHVGMRVAVRLTGTNAARGQIDFALAGGSDA